MKKILTVVLIGMGTSLALLAAPAAPEIDAGSAGTALVLLTGAILAIRGRRKE